MMKSCKLKYTTRWFIYLGLIITIAIYLFSKSIGIFDDRFWCPVVVEEFFNDIQSYHKSVYSIIEENRFHYELCESIFFYSDILKLLNEIEVGFFWGNNRSHFEEIHGRRYKIPFTDEELVCRLLDIRESLSIFHFVSDDESFLSEGRYDSVSHSGNIYCRNNVLVGKF